MAFSSPSESHLKESKLDLRNKNLTPSQMERVKSLIIEGLISYQPFIFSDDLEVGVGFEFEEGRYAGLVHFPDLPKQLLASPELARRVLPIADKDRFRVANRRLATYYDKLVEQICVQVGGAATNTFLDVGCNTGYIPLKFALQGAKCAAGCDRQDFSKVFQLLNPILGTDAKFVHAWYKPEGHCINDIEQFDVVTSMAMVCHVSDPLHLLSSLGRISRKALFVWTLFSDDESNVVRYGDPRGDYFSDSFPYCFDNMTVPSVPLLKKSMELMGFSRIVELSVGAESGRYSWKGYPFRGFLGVREGTQK